MAMSLRHNKQGANLMNNWRCLKLVWRIFFLGYRWPQRRHRDDIQHHLLHIAVEKIRVLVHT